MPDVIPPPASSRLGLVPHVHVRVGRCHMAVPIDQVRQALPLPPQGLTALPRRSGGLLGVADVDGAAVPIVALVGYTNAGKSSIFNSLVKARAYAADQLFATLDTTTRQLYLGEAGRSVSLSDTVGFIRDLPHGLVDAFAATLQEAADADLLTLIAALSMSLARMDRVPEPPSMQVDIVDEVALESVAPQAVAEPGGSPPPTPVEDVPEPDQVQPVTPPPPTTASRPSAERAAERLDPASGAPFGAAASCFVLSRGLVCFTLQRIS